MGGRRWEQEERRWEQEGRREEVGAEGGGGGSRAGPVAQTDRLTFRA